MTRLGLVLMHMAKWTLLVTVFLVPVVALPWTTDIFETNKQLVYILGIGLALTCFVLSRALSKRAFQRPGLVMLVPVLILIVSILSAANSLAPGVSWWGQGAQEYVSIVAGVAFISAFFVTVALSKEAGMQHSIILALFAGSAFSSLAFWIIWLGFGVATVTNLVGTPHAFGVYLLAMTMVACGVWLTGTDFSKKWQRRWFQSAAGITYITTIVVLLALDSINLWWLCLASTGTLFLVAVIQANKFHNHTVLLPTILLAIVALIFLILPVRIPSPFFPEVTPNAVTTWGVITGAWNEASVALGTGPGTFSLMYPKYVSLGINQSDFWDIIFDRGNAFVTTQLATTGVLGVFTWIFFAGLVLVLAGKNILAADKAWLKVLPVFLGWWVLTLAAFIYGQNFTLSALFWTLVAMLAGMLANTSKGSVSPSARSHLASMLIAVVVIVGFMTVLVVTIPRYLAEVAFAQAVKTNATAKTASEIDDLMRLLDKAAEYNPNNDTYYRNLAGVLLRRLSVLTDEEKSDNEYIQSLIVATLEAAERATELSPENVLNWEVRGLVFRELLAVVPDAALPSITAYERAIVLAPINPRYRVEAARAYMASADAKNPLLQNQDADVAAQALKEKTAAMIKAEDHLKMAIELKRDYAPAHYYSALLQERLGNLTEAVSGLKFVQTQAPQDIGVGLQLGLLYLRQGKNDLARLELERLLEIAPDYADAHWYLSVVFEQVGDLPSAIQAVEQVLITNPNNTAVQARLDRLKAGLTTNQIPEPIQ